MFESANTTVTNTLGSQISFYEYPPEKPFINSIYQPLRPSCALSKTVALPESNRDQLLTALQSLTLRIKTLENERERAELNLRQITSDIQRSRADYKRPPSTSDKQVKKVGRNLYSHQDQCHKSLHPTDDSQYHQRVRSGRKMKQTSQENPTSDGINSDGRHFHLDMNTVPFILGASTTPSHNVKSNIQNVIALLKTHNHQFCLSSKEYSELLNSNLKSTSSPHIHLHPDHSNKSPIKRSSSSSSPIRRPSTTSSKKRPSSTSRRPQTSSLSDKQYHSRIKRLHQEFSLLSQEHKRLITSRTNSKESYIISRRMNNILDELEQLERQLKLFSTRKSSSKDQIESESSETPLETLKKTRQIQSILKNPTNKHHRRTRPTSND